eukprot:gene7155-14570_t
MLSIGLVTLGLLAIIGIMSSYCSYSLVVYLHRSGQESKLEFEIFLGVTIRVCMPVLLTGNRVRMRPAGCNNLSVSANVGKSHSGVSITLGVGTIFAQSVKQKLVSKSLIEAELIAFSDGISQAAEAEQGFKGEYGTEEDTERNTDKPMKPPKAMPGLTSTLQSRKKIANSGQVRTLETMQSNRDARRPTTSTTTDLPSQPPATTRRCNGVNDDATTAPAPDPRNVTTTDDDNNTPVQQEHYSQRGNSRRRTNMIQICRDALAIGLTAEHLLQRRETKDEVATPQEIYDEQGYGGQNFKLALKTTSKRFRDHQTTLETLCADEIE